MKLHHLIIAIAICGCSEPQPQPVTEEVTESLHDRLIKEFIETSDNSYIVESRNKNAIFIWKHEGIVSTDTATYDAFALGTMDGDQFLKGALLYVNLKRKEVYEYDMAYHFLLVQGGTGTHPSQLPEKISEQGANRYMEQIDSLIKSGAVKILHYSEQSESGGELTGYINGDGQLVLIESNFSGAESLNYTRCYFKNTWPVIIAYKRETLFAKGDNKELLEETNYYLTGYKITSTHVVTEAQWGATYKNNDDFIIGIRNMENDLYREFGVGRFHEGY